MSECVLGDVLICGSGQSGTVIQICGELWILLLNGDIWIGPSNQCRFPQDEADLAACPLNVERLEKPIIRSKED